MTELFGEPQMAITRATSSVPPDPDGLPTFERLPKR